MSEPYDITAYEAITVSNTAIGFTSVAYNYALVTVETDSIRFRVDGTDPTSSEGHKLDPGDTVELLGGNAILYFRAIRTSSDATIRVSLGFREMAGV